MMVEEYNFWRTKKSKFVMKLLGIIFILGIAIVGVIVWLIYNENKKESQVLINQPENAPVIDSKPESTNASASSLAPLPAQPSPN
jgi:hypothetical protein